MDVQEKDTKFMIWALLQFNERVEWWYKTIVLISNDLGDRHQMDEDCDNDNDVDLHLIMAFYVDQLKFLRQSYILFVVLYL